MYARAPARTGDEITPLRFLCGVLISMQPAYTVPSNSAFHRAMG